MSKKKDKKLIIIFIILSLTFTIAIVNLRATEVSNIELCEVEENEEIPEECGQYKVSAASNPDKFFSEPLLSVDDDIREKEKDKWYYKYFLSAHFITNALDTNNTDGSDTIDEALAAIPIGISYLLGSINLLFSSLIMFIANVAISGYISDSVNLIIIKLNDVVFDWDNLAGTGMIIALALGLIVIIKNTLFYFKTDRPIKDYIKMIFTTIIIAILIPLSFTTIRPPLQQIDEQINTKIMDVILDGEIEEINTKKNVFNVMAYNGFVVKHFGVIDTATLAARDNQDNETAKSRIKGILSKDEESITSEINTYDNKFIPRDHSSAWITVIFTFFFTVHAILAFFILLVPFLLMILIDILKVLSYGFIFYTFVKMLFGEEDRPLSSFLWNRIQWIFVFILASLSIQILLQFIFLSLNFFSTGNILLMLVYEIFVIVIYAILWMIKDQIIEMFKFILKSTPGIVKGTKSVGEFGGELKSTASNIKSEIVEIFADKLKNKESDDSEEYDDEIDEYEHDYEEGLEEDGNASTEKKPIDMEECTEESDKDIQAEGDQDNNDLLEPNNEIKVEDDNQEEYSEAEYNEDEYNEAEYNEDEFNDISEVDVNKNHKELNDEEQSRYQSYEDVGEVHEEDN